MKIKKMSLLFVLIGTALLSGGCQKQEPAAEPETIMDSLVPPAEQPETNTVPPTEPAESIPAQDSAAGSADIPAQGSAANPAPTAAPNTDSASPGKFITVSKAFTITDTWISTISFQMPENWSYRTDEDPTDWGFWVDMPDHEDFSLYIHALPGSYNVDGPSPTDFATDSGMKGKLYMTQFTGDDGLSHIDEDIVFDQQPASGISLSANEDTYNQYKDTLQKIFLSVTIQNTFTE